MVHGQWEREKFIGTELNNKTVGVIGLGKIGSEVIKRLHPFKMRILGFDPYIKDKIYDLDIDDSLDFKMGEILYYENADKFSYLLSEEEALKSCHTRLLKSLAER